MGRNRAKRKYYLEDKARMANSLIQLVSERQHFHDDAHRMFLGMVKAIVTSLEERDAYTHGHSLRVTNNALLIGRTIGLTENQLERLQLSALFHDIGKIGIPDEILIKPGKLTEDETKIMQTHPVRSQHIIETVPGLEDVVPAVRHHHERLDGRGYPDQLSGSRIPLYSRIILIADTYDAMTSSRSYRKALDPSIAYEEISRHKGTQFDPELADAFLKEHPNLVPDTFDWLKAS